MLMDRFVKVLQPELQSRLKHKVFTPFENLSDKADFLAIATEYAQTRSQFRAVHAASEEMTANSELAQVVKALERLTKKKGKGFCSFGRNTEQPCHNEKKTRSATGKVQRLQTEFQTTNWGFPEKCCVLGIPQDLRYPSIHR